MTERQPADQGEPPVELSPARAAFISGIERDDAKWWRSVAEHPEHDPWLAGLRGMWLELIERLRRGGPM